MGKKKSIIWVMSKEDFYDIVKKSFTRKQILNKLNLGTNGNNYSTLNNRIKTDKIDISHFDVNKIKTRYIKKDKKSIEDILKKDSNYNRTYLKKRLINDKILNNKCNICNLEPVWNNKELVLILDHINGIPNDNRIENLRLLCPNCNSQTDTFAGRKKRIKNICPICKKIISKKSNFCRSHVPKKRKVKRPRLDRLIMYIDKYGYSAAGRKYGVSDNAIRKWLK